MKIEPNKLMSIPEVAEYLGVKISTIYDWVHCRQIPYHKIGRLVRFRPSDIDAWIASKRVEVYDLGG